MSERLSLRVLLLSMLAFTAWAGAAAQVQNASLTGLISDPAGAVVNGAAVTVKNTATNVTYSQKTDLSGYYLFPSLPIGSYTISVQMMGFKQAVRDNVI